MKSFLVCLACLVEVSAFTPLLPAASMQRAAAGTRARAFYMALAQDDQKPEPSTATRGKSDPVAEEYDGFRTDAPSEDPSITCFLAPDSAPDASSSKSWVCTERVKLRSVGSNEDGY